MFTRKPTDQHAPDAGHPQLAGLNLDFLQLLRAVRQTQRKVRIDLALPESQAETLSRCEAAALQRMAGCGFALYALNLHRMDDWANLAQQSRMALSGQPSAPAQDGDALAAQLGRFMSCSVFYAWHLAQQPQTARLLLGMAAETAAILRELSLAQCQYIARRYTRLLSVRWQHNRYFWPDLLRYGISGQREHFRLAQLLGTQLMAQDLEPSAIARLTEMDP